MNSGPPKFAPERLRTAAAAAAYAAGRRGIVLRDQEAEDVARAVLEHADGEPRVMIEVSPRYWPSARETALARLRHRLAAELVDGQLLPVALPREVVTDPPTGTPWETVKVELVVPVRRPVGQPR